MIYLIEQLFSQNVIAEFIFWLTGKPCAYTKDVRFSLSCFDWSYNFYKPIISIIGRMRIFLVWFFISIFSFYISFVLCTTWTHLLKEKSKILSLCWMNRNNNMCAVSSMEIPTLIQPYERHIENVWLGWNERWDERKKRAMQCDAYKMKKDEIRANARVYSISHINTVGKVEGKQIYTTQTFM